MTAEPIAHKTRTIMHGTETPYGVDFYGRPHVICGQIFKALCSCGWKGDWCDDRQSARYEARHHREKPPPAPRRNPWKLRDRIVYDGYPGTVTGVRSDWPDVVKVIWDDLGPLYGTEMPVEVLRREPVR